jgi:polysaccharide biosynthesis protein PslG
MGGQSGGAGGAQAGSSGAGGRTAVGGASSPGGSSGAAGDAGAGGSTGAGARQIRMSDFLGFNVPLLTVVNGTPAFDEPHYVAYVARLKALGLRRIRLDFHWAVLEPTAGALSPVAMGITDTLVNRLQADGISVLVQLGGVPTYYSAPGCPASEADRCPPTDTGVAALAARMVDLAQRYPSIETWQIGNEPNLSAFGMVSFAGAYAKMARAVVDAFAAAGLAHKLALAGMGYYGDYTPTPSPQYPMMTGSMLKDLATQEGSLVSALEAVAYHPYTDTPEGEPGGLNPMTSGDFVTRATSLNAALRATGNVHRIWATEFGWSTYPALNGVLVQTPVDQKTQADYLLRRLALVFGALDYERVYLFALADMGAGPVTVPYASRSGSERDDFYGVLALDGTPKVAYTALAQLLSITSDQLTLSPPFTTGTGESSTVYGPVFTRTDGKHVWMARSSAAKTVTIPGASAATLYDCVAGTNRPATVVGAAAEVPLAGPLSVVVY